MALEGAHTFRRDSNGYPNVLELNQNDDADWLNAWNAYDDDRWNRENVFVFLAPQLSLFPASRGVLLVKLSRPSAKHPPYFIVFFRECDVFFCVYCFYFPKDLQEKFHHIDFYCRSLHIGQLLIFSEIACGESKFRCGYQQCIDFLTDGITRVFRHMRQEFMPQLVA